jgi:hypothetical protein
LQARILSELAPPFLALEAFSWIKTAAGKAACSGSSGTAYQPKFSIKPN